MMNESIVDETTIIPIIPMKPLADCKTRLSRTLTAEERGDLVIGMLRRVLMAIKGASVEVFWVVGGDWRIRNLTRNFDGIWLEDLGRNLNDTVDKSFDRASQRGLRGHVPARRPALHQVRGYHEHDFGPPAMAATLFWRPPGAIAAPTES